MTPRRRGMRSSVLIDNSPRRRGMRPSVLIGNDPRRRGMRPSVLIGNDPRRRLDLLKCYLFDNFHFVIFDFFA